jgi:hypothetical protein
VFREKFTKGKQPLRLANGGKWSVRNGELRAAVSRDARRAGALRVALHRTRPRATQFRLGAELTVPAPTDRARAAALVLGYRGKRDFLQVRLGPDRARPGVYRSGRARAIRLTALAPSAGTHRVEVRVDVRTVKVYVDGDFAAKVTVPRLLRGRVGVGAVRGPVRFDNLWLARNGTSSGGDSTPGPGAAPPSASPGSTGSPPVGPPLTSPTPPEVPGPVGAGRAVRVGTSAELTAALADARPGDVIELADGSYNGKWVNGKYTAAFGTSASGTAEAPITLVGSRAAVIDGGNVRSHYGLYWADASHWRILGLTVTRVSKGIVLDRSSHNVLDRLRVVNTGEEGIHLRANSSHNVVRSSEVTDTGLRNATYGEGLYVGSASSNWGTYTNGQPDRSDGNSLLNNVVARTGAENVDIKEGTTGGVIRGNVFDGAGMTGSWADSMIDVKGNGWLIADNRGANGVLDGFQVHNVYDGWGYDNVFTGNRLTVNAPGYGFRLHNTNARNRIGCDNVVEAAGSGFANVPCAG